MKSHHLSSKIKVIMFVFKVTLLLDLLKMIQLSQTNSNTNKQTTEESGHRQQVSTLFVKYLPNVCLNIYRQQVLYLSNIFLISN